VVEKISAETPANITALDHTDIQQTPGVNLDDRLREVPGFSLFRRSSSLAANPTTQGISLRGLGSSGASRSLVLWDGIPVNDPFGGWVYWTQFPMDELDRVELSRGASTSLFGDRAMTGTVALFSREPQIHHLTAGYQGGNHNTHELSLGLSNAWSSWGISGFGRAFTTDGYYIVPENFNGRPLRGSADQLANVRFASGDVHIDHYTAFGNFFLKSNVLAEERQNGTAVTHNSTGLGTISLRYEKQFRADSISLLGYHTREGFHATFDTVTNNRNTDRLTFQQTVPSEAVGGALLWQHHTAAWNLLGGADVNRIEGTTTDRLAPTGQRVGGGVQLEHGVFGQADFRLGPARFFAGMRHSFAGQGDTFLSPSAGFAIGKGRLRGRGSVYRAFRAPTLNELYRVFVAGNATTLANPLLQPETVFGAETGFDYSISDSGGLRFTAFRNSVDKLITNVTQPAPPGQTIRQRQNAGTALSRGIEAGVRQRLGHWSGELSYLFADTRYVAGPLDRLRVAQVPKHQGSGEIAYLRGGTMASAAVRSYSFQFDDDPNLFRLPGFATLQFVGSQRLTKSLRAEAALENALDHKIFVALTPTPNIGAPRLWRLGLRWDGKMW
jgi:outer membrane cobalamin receptor